MSIQSVIVDWISITLAKEPKGWPYFDDESATPIPALYHYHLGWKDRYGAMVFTGGHNKGIHCQWSGDCLDSLRQVGVKPVEMIDGLLSLDPKFTRLDLAVDLIGSRLSVESIINHAKKRLANLRVRSWDVRASANGGLTIYLGSRSSMRFVRAYNKRAELAARAAPTDFEWTRIEVQLKDEYALGSAITCVEYGIEATIAYHLMMIGDFPKLAAWQRMIDNLGQPCIVSTSHHRPKDTQKWLIESVAPTLARELSDPRFLALWQDYLSELSPTDVPTIPN